MSSQFTRFNLGVWKKLEMQVRDLELEYDSLYLVIGPIFNSVMLTIGSVPKVYYKVLL